MKPDLTTLDGQRRAARRGAYVVFGCAACGVLWEAVLAHYPEDRLQAAAMICFFGGVAASLIPVLRQMSLKQKWKDGGSLGSPPQQSGFEIFLGIIGVFITFPCAGIFFILSGSLYPHWHNVYSRNNPSIAIMLGSLMVVVSLFIFGTMLPAIYKARFRKT